MVAFRMYFTFSIIIVILMTVRGEKDAQNLVRDDNDTGNSSEILTRLQIQMDDMRQQLEVMQIRHRNEISTLKDKLDVIARSCHATRSKRFLTTPAFNGNVAFDTYLSHAVSHPSPTQILLYDVVLTNVGNAYDRNIGVFFAPVSGAYLFSWTMTAGYGAYCISHLTVNGKHIATTEADGSMESKFISSATKTTIISLNVGDRVYIQISSSRGDLFSNDNLYGHSGFSGTLLFETD